MQELQLVDVIIQKSRLYEQLLSIFWLIKVNSQLYLNYWNYVQN